MTEEEIRLQVIEELIQIFSDKQFYFGGESVFYGDAVSVLQDYKDSREVH